MVKLFEFCFIKRYQPLAKIEIKRLIKEIQLLFPEVVPLMAEHENCATSFRMEAFANLTTYAFNNGELEAAAAHLDYINNKLTNASPPLCNFIDAYYVEHLFWRATQRGIDLGWPLLPTNLKQLYLDFHGNIPTLRT